MGRYGGRKGHSRGGGFSPEKYLLRQGGTALDLDRAFREFPRLKGGTASKFPWNAWKKALRSRSLPDGKSVQKKKGWRVLYHKADHRLSTLMVYRFYALVQSVQEVIGRSLRMCRTLRYNEDARGSNTRHRKKKGMAKKTKTQRGALGRCTIERISRLSSALSGVNQGGVQENMEKKQGRSKGKRSFRGSRREKSE